MDNGKSRIPDFKHLLLWKNTINLHLRKLK